MAKRTVMLLGQEYLIQNEDDKAGAAITPGMIINYDGSGNWVAHATAAATVLAPTVALEREEMGGDYDTAYALNDTVKAATLSPGMRFNALIANAVNVAAKGALLESAGNGTLRNVTTGVARFRSLQILNNTSGANARLRVEVI